MVWNRKVSALISIWFLLVMFSGLQSAFSQTTDQPVWTDDQWKNAKGGMGYENYSDEEDEQPQKEDESKKEETADPYPTETEDDISNWNMDSLFSSSMAKFIGIMILLVLLVVVVYFFMQGKKTNKDSKLQLELERMPDVLEDLPKETDLERFLRLSIEASDYKTAIRILYIMIIQSMHENRWIIWKKDKTNYDYLREVRTRKSFSKFREITLVYEVVWYGDNDISGSEFQKLKPLFEEYKGSVNKGDNAQ